MNVLLVDDSKTALQQLEIVIRQVDHTINVVTCETIKEAHEVLKTEPIDIAFIDLQMPEENGADLIVRINDNPALNHIRLIIVTATGGDSLLKTSLEQMVEVYLHKPVNKQQISKLLNYHHNMPIIDFDSLKAAYEDDLIELLQVFKEDADDDFQSLIKAVDEGDPTEIKRFAHKMKGSSMIVMDDKLEDITQEIEKNHTNPDAVKPLLDQLKDYYPKISQEIGAYLG